MEKFGLITLDENGIKARRFWHLFGQSFELTWQEITAWAAAKMVLTSARARGNAVRILEFQVGKKLYVVQWKKGEAEFDKLVDCIRQRVRDKETESLLQKYQDEHPPKSDPK